MTDERPPIVPVVLSGGSGTRLWPASRERQPKQLLPLIEHRSMIHATIDRVSSLPAVAPPTVVTNVGHAIPVRRALADAGFVDATVILEPEGRNTAPAVAVAALDAMATHGDALLLVLPADHAITDEPAFADAVERAAAAASDGYLVTFGITPTSPETGYGYIRSGDHLMGPILRIEEFKEKPDAATAGRYVDSGAYSWNSGMFIFRASRYLEELGEFRPDIASATTDAWASRTATPEGMLLDRGAFAACPSDSVDFAVMEHTDRGAVLPIEAGWSDVGSWASLWDIGHPDTDGNVTSGDVIVVDTEGSYIRASERVIAAVGLRDVVIVDTPDALLVTTRDRSQDVKLVVDRLRSAERPEVESNGTEYEPWGTARLVGATPGHRTHVVVVDVGASIPDRADPERSMHWQVVEGTADITIDGTSETLSAGASRFVPPGRTHGIANAGGDALMLIRIVVDTVVDSDELTTFAAKEGESP